MDGCGMDWVYLVRGGDTIMHGKFYFTNSQMLSLEGPETHAPLYCQLFEAMLCMLIQYAWLSVKAKSISKKDQIAQPAQLNCMLGTKASLMVGV